MKKKTASQSAFFNLRALIGLFLVVAGVCLALLGFGVAHAQQNQAQPVRFTPANPIDPLVPRLFDCSRIQEFGIDKQENLVAGAIMVACGQAEGGTPSPTAAFDQALKDILDYGVTDKNLITGAETSPNITQSETFTAGNPDNPNQILVAYNDSRGRNAVPVNISGASYSSDGGTTFTRLTAASGQSPFPNTFGDPVVLYNKPTGTWITVWLDGACGAQGLGGYKTTTPAVAASWTHFCVHNNNMDDRNSGWADNNPASPFYGRLYITWNDFNVAGGALFATHSTDAGVTWAAPVQISTAFFRDVQLTGDSSNGNLYLASMMETSGLSTRQNKMYRSTNGGVTWTNTYNGPVFDGPGRGASGFFGTMYNSPVFWRHQGYGEPAALNGIVHYVYAARNTGNGDPGNVFYIRSTDAGVTFSAPFMLNTNVDPTKAQWQPNISVTSGGSLFAAWYDERERVAASCQPSSPNTPCYRMWARKSNDNGVTWLPDEAYSDVVSPLPLQPDPGIVATYAGDYDYASAGDFVHLNAWVDGRVPIAAASQQNAFFDKSTACNGSYRVLIVYGDNTAPPSTLRTNLLAQSGVAAVDLFDGASGTPTLAQLQQYDIVVAYSNTQYADGTTLGNNLADYQDANGIVIASFGSFYNGSAGYAIGGRWQSGGYSPYTYSASTLFTAVTLGVFDATHPLMQGVTTLNALARIPAAPAAGATQVAAYSDTTSAVAFKATAGHTAVGLPAYVGDGANSGTGNYARVIINAGRWLKPLCANTCNNYTATTSTGNAIVPGTTFVAGSNCDDCSSGIPLPFSFSFYGNAFTLANASSNGNVQFSTGMADFNNACLPYPAFNDAILPHWDDLILIGTGGGIYTSVSGVAPNRIFNIEWRGGYFSGGGTVNFEIRLYETSNQIDFVYGTVTQTGTSATVGLQRDTGSSFTQFSCNTSSITSGLKITYNCTGAPLALSAVSRKTHTGAGAFDVDLPLSGTEGIECRRGGGANFDTHQVVVTFASPVTVGGVTVTSPDGGAGAATQSAAGAIVTINLTGVLDAHNYFVTLTNVSDGTNTGSISIPVGMLRGDTNADRFVNSGDAQQTRNRAGQTTDAINFRSDVNTDGVVNSGDSTIVRGRAGNFLP